MSLFKVSRGEEKVLLYLGDNHVDQAKWEPLAVNREMVTKHCVPKPPAERFARHHTDAVDDLFARGFLLLDGGSTRPRVKLSDVGLLVYLGLVAWEVCINGPKAKAPELSTEKTVERTKDAKKGSAAGPVDDASSRPTWSGKGRPPKGWPRCSGCNKPLPDFDAAWGDGKRCEKCSRATTKRNLHDRPNPPEIVVRRASASGTSEATVKISEEQATSTSATKAEWSGRGRPPPDWPRCACGKPMSRLDLADGHKHCSRCRAAAEVHEGEAPLTVEEPDGEPPLWNGRGRPPFNVARCICGNPAQHRHQGDELCAGCFEKRTAERDDSPPPPPPKIGKAVNLRAAIAGGVR